MLRFLRDIILPSLVASLGINLIIYKVVLPLLEKVQKARYLKRHPNEAKLLRRLDDPDVQSAVTTVNREFPPVKGIPQKRRWNIRKFLPLVFCVVVVTASPFDKMHLQWFSPATYYIDYLGGNDANNGLTKGAAWKTHPYMANTAIAGYSHAEGDQFIFKGGVTWPNACFVMNIPAGGSAGNIDYYGVDATWYTGGAWTRPIWDGEDAAITGGRVR
jgi:hypothetical protein